MEHFVVAIGASAGGIDALRMLLPKFKRGLPLAILVVVHLPSDGPNLIPELFQDECEFTIKEADSGEPIEAGHIYIAPPDYHLSGEARGTLSLSNEAPVNFSRPSIDIMMESVARAFAEKSIGVLLTGANEDGALGMKEIQRCGGKTFVQDPEEAEYPTMPLSCLELIRPYRVLKVKDMAHAIQEQISGVSYE